MKTTVKDVIKQLQKFPEDMRVVMLNDYNGGVDDLSVSEANIALNTDIYCHKEGMSKHSIASEDHLQEIVKEKCVLLTKGEI